MILEATERRRVLRLGVAAALKYTPLTAESQLRYATAFFESISALASPQPVLPISPISYEKIKHGILSIALAQRIFNCLTSPDHEAKMMVRFGTQPVFNNSPNPLAISSSALVPLLGSTEDGEIGREKRIGHLKALRLSRFYYYFTVLTGSKRPCICWKT